jgi:chromosome segregation ATPase
LAQKNTAHLKEWQEQQTKIKQISQELSQIIEDATTEITGQETENKQLRSKLSQASQQINDLKKHLKLTKTEVNDYQRAAELRINEPKSKFAWSD